MKYILKIFAIGHEKRLEISESEYQDIKKSNRILYLFNDFTLNYRITLDSYRKVEVSQHELALDHILQGCSPHSVYKDALDATVALNSALMGYLTTARFFHEWANKHLPKAIGDAAFENFKKFRSDIYDSTPEYKFVEALRNHVQHKGVPKHIKYNNFRDDTENFQKSEIGTTILFYADKNKLQDDSDFKKSALNSMPEKINVVKCIRAHMSGIWRIHDFVISNHSGKADEAREIFEKHIGEFHKEFGGNLTGLCACDEAEQTRIYLDLNRDDARRAVLRKLEFANLKNLSKQYTTGKIQE